MILTVHVCSTLTWSIYNLFTAKHFLVCTAEPVVYMLAISGELDRSVHINIYHGLLWSDAWCMYAHLIIRISSFSVHVNSEVEI